MKSILSTIIAEKGDVMKYDRSSNLETTLAARAYQLRRDSLRATAVAGSGHPTSCLSAADIVAVLFFEIMRCDPDRYEAVQNDRFILSKGHAAPLLYAIWKQLGKISDDELMQLRTFDSPLEGHPTSRFRFAEGATGSLGQGLSLGVGQALAIRMCRSLARVFVLLGDGEMAEGSVWEAADLAAYYHLSRLVAIVDVNRLGQTGETAVGHHSAVYVERFAAFGWRTIEVDGHDIASLLRAFTLALSDTGEHSLERRPCAIIAKTLKGAGLPVAVEDRVGFHGKAFPLHEVERYLEALAEACPSCVTFEVAHPAMMHRPEEMDCVPTQSREGENTIVIDTADKAAMATREAYGYALVEIGKSDERVVCLDGDVKNSTFTEYFEKHFPHRFVQCFIAEQNMIGVAAGLAARGKIPFAATFAAFLTRAHDQIRMAAIGRVPLRLMGSHAGLSIGQDGPSQMGLEDLAMMRSLSNSIVLYPSDAVCTAACVGLMHDYQDGISYLRATRMETPIIYDKDEVFVVGGGKILHRSESDVVCIIGAGITVFEALKAYEQLRNKGIYCRIIDCYSVKPLPIEILRSSIDACKGRVIIAEDHYREGGLGEAIFSALVDMPLKARHCAVRELPRSGTPQELLAFAGIDANSIEKAVLSLI